MQLAFLLIVPAVYNNSWKLRNKYYIWDDCGLIYDYREQKIRGIVIICRSRDGISGKMQYLFQFYHGLGILCVKINFIR